MGCMLCTCSCEGCTCPMHMCQLLVGVAPGVPRLLFTLVSETGSLSKASRALIQLPWLASELQGPTFFYPLS